VLAAALAAAPAGCGSAPPPPVAEPTEPAREPAPPPPPSSHRVALSVITPEPATTRGALAADGSFFCRDVWSASPPEDERHCLADGHGITAHVLIAIGGDGAQRNYLERPIEVRRIENCGNRERRIRRPPRALLTRVAPDLADAPPASEADLQGAAFISCVAPDVLLEIPHGAEIVHAGSLLRVRAPTGGAVRVLARDREAAAFDLDASACAAELALEILCAGDAVVIAGGPIGCDPGAAITTTNLPCVPEATPIGPSFVTFQRILVNTATGVSVPISITPPRLVPR
jgi:hypothetical protein